MRFKFLGVGILLSCLSLKAQSDDPCGATPLNIDTVCTFETGSTVGATSTAGVPGPGCGSYTNKDVWYTLTVPASGSINIETATGTLSDCAMALYDGICASLNLLTCDDDSGPGLMPLINATGLTPGATIWLRIWRFGGGGTGTFQICAWDPPIVFENADCITATQICTTTAFDDNNSGDGDINDLNASNKGCLSEGEHQSAWYYFIISTAGTLTFTIDPDVNSDDYDFAIWGPGPSCPPSTPPLRCSFSSANGNTGLNMTALDLSEGVGGDKFVKYLDVLAGEVYYLCIDNYLATNEGFTFSFGGTATISCEPLVLPVTLINFQGVAVEAINVLSWSTETEINAAWFYVEHSENGKDFKTIGKLAANGNSNQIINYSMLHNTPLFGNNYYRLLQEDADGKSVYSEIISVENLLSAALHVFPNPTENGAVQIEFNSAIGVKLIIQIFNREGNIVQEMEIIASSTNSNQLIQLPAPGIYFIRVTTQNRSLTEKIIY